MHKFPDDVEETDPDDENDDLDPALLEKRSVVKVSALHPGWKLRTHDIVYAAPLRFSLHYLLGVLRIFLFSCVKSSFMFRFESVPLGLMYLLLV